ncbi:hypothetical protein VTI74DRAFT_10296 [Chaetomium olivicolor]
MLVGLTTDGSLNCQSSSPSWERRSTSANGEIHRSSMGVWSGGHAHVGSTCTVPCKSCRRGGRGVRRRNAGYSRCRSRKNPGTGTNTSERTSPNPIRVALVLSTRERSCSLLLITLYDGSVEAAQPREVKLGSLRLGLWEVAHGGVVSPPGA